MSAEVQTLAEMDRDELNALELDEYRTWVDHLAKDPYFIAFMAKWVVDAGELPIVPITVEAISHTNYTIGRVSLLREFMESLRLVHHAAYLNIQGEVDRYVSRRSTVDERSDGDAGTDTDDFV